MTDTVFTELPDEKVLALTLYGETRGEPREGKIAVGSVILERVDHRDWDGKTIKEVCLKPFQFSCYNQSDPNYKRLLRYAVKWDETDKVLAECLEIATGLVTGTISRTKEIAESHCCQYLTTAAKKNVDWWRKMVRVLVIRTHEFYAERRK